MDRYRVLAHSPLSVHHEPARVPTAYGPRPFPHHTIRPAKIYLCVPLRLPSFAPKTCVSLKINAYHIRNETSIIKGTRNNASKNKRQQNCDAMRRLPRLSP
ncbi:unnamed protein product, partial [Ectocarpus sp. 4 AP-2014]